MATLTTLFDASEYELGDLLGDTSILVKVQELVLELFNCGEVRAQGIHIELVEKFGAFALPGIISASYIEGDRKSNNKTIMRISNVVYDVVAGNDAAQQMVLRDGIIRNPFPKSHSIFIQALNKHRFVPNQHEYQRINEALRTAQQNQNMLQVLSLYQFLVSLNETDLKIITSASEQCVQWFRQDYGEYAAKLAHTILIHNPKQTELVVRTIFAQSYDKNSSIHREITQHVHLDNEQIALEAMRVLIEYLVRTGQRNTTVEYFFDGPIAKHIKNQQFIDAAHALVIQSDSEHVYRYWWRAISKMSRESCVLDYLTTRLLQFCTTHREFAKWGVMQLMMIEQRNPGLPWCVYHIEVIAEQFSDIYVEADEVMQKINNAPKRIRRERPTLGTTTIRRHTPNTVGDDAEDAS